METQLIEYVKVEAMVAAYNDALNEIGRAYDLLASAQQRLTVAFEARYGFDVNPDKYLYGDDRVGADRTKKVTEQLHKTAVAAIVEKLKIRPMLSEKRLKQLDEQLEKGNDLPEISEQGIEGFVEGIAGNLGTYFAEAVDEVFEWLRPRQSEYKTNTEFEVGERVVLCAMVERDYSKPFRANSYRQQRLTALDNVFCYLDGKGKPENGTYHGPLCDAIEAVDASGYGQTDYFEFRCYRNGNLHLKFRRMDLVKQMNAMAGGNRLRQGVAA